MPRDPLSRTARRVEVRAAYRRLRWPVRLWHELGSVSTEPDTVVRLIVVERLVKSAVLVVFATSPLTVGRQGYLQRWAVQAQEQLNLAAGHGAVVRVLQFALGYFARLPHPTVLAVGALLYAALETTEGLGLAMRRRWADYLTVLATGVLIPWEVAEVFRRVTPLRVGALAVNVAIVVYLAYRKRLFVDV